MSRSLDFSAFYDAKPDQVSEVVSLYGVHWRGDDLLEAVFRDSGVFNVEGVEQPQRFQFKGIARRHNLAAALVRGYFLNAEKRSPPTRGSYNAYLRPFFTFLDDVDPEAAINALSHIDTSLVNRFIAWLSERKVKGQGGVIKPMSRDYKDDVYGQLKAVVDALRKDGRNDIATDCEFRRNPWSSQAIIRSRRVPAASSILSDPQLRTIHRACQQEIEDILKAFDEAEELIRSKDHVGEPDGAGVRLNDLAGVLTYVDRRYGGVLPNFHEIQRTNPTLANAIARLGGREMVVSRMTATPTTLLPFILVLLMRTFFNPDALVGIKDSFCREAHWLWGGTNWEVLSGDLSQEGEKELARLVNGGISPEAAIRTVLSSYKGRKRDMVTRTFRISDQWDSPPKLIEQVRRLTRRLRVNVPEVWQDRLFLFQPLKTKEGGPRSFMDQNGPSSDSLLITALKRFRAKHGLTNFTMSAFRITGADIVWEATDGDTSAVAAMLGNEIKTAAEHYNTPGNVLRSEHRIAVMTNRRVRMVKTSGRSRIEFAGCTPGFHCIDPYNSPQPGQTEGELCTAFPACPSCPLAALDAARPDRVAWVMHLADRIESDEPALDPARYEVFYKPILNDIHGKWLSRVSPDIRREAELLSAGLPPMAEME
jgi:hypothetical protein